MVDTALLYFKLTRAKPFLSLGPGAEYGPAKQWPPRHYSALAQEKISSGWQVWVFGSAKDQGIARQIQEDLDNQNIDQTQPGQLINLCGRTSLAQAIDLMSLSQAVVSNDSGLMHMGAALGVPVVGIYGSSDPGFTPPLGKNTAIASLQLSCSPCFKRTCPLGHTDCLYQLQPQLVLDKLQQLEQRAVQ